MNVRSPPLANPRYSQAGYNKEKGDASKLGGEMASPQTNKLPDKNH